MATFYGQGRTNTFAVKDVEALKAALSDTDIEVLDVGSHSECRLLKWNVIPVSFATFC